MRKISKYGSSSPRKRGPIFSLGSKVERGASWVPAFAGMTKLGAGASLLILTACTPNDPTLGGSIRHNYALQVIDPDPQYAGTPNEGGSGDLAKGAVERYRTDKVKKVKTIRTTSGISGGSGGGSSK
ncbi:MAG TPA: hypothetical protein VJM81_09520 [Rhizorhapis sp.]|nr:hypothetical protein [Rhizorhapis sp.]